MTLTDTGPLVALLDRRDTHHLAATETAAKLPIGTMVTTWPCLTEAMHLLGKKVGYVGQAALWGMIADGLMGVRESTTPERFRMAELMRVYRDLPMDLADASLVVAAEGTGQRRVFSFDNHFRVYVLDDGSTLDVVP